MQNFSKSKEIIKRDIAVKFFSIEKYSKIKLRYLKRKLSELELKFVNFSSNGNKEIMLNIFKKLPTKDKKMNNNIVVFWGENSLRKRILRFSNNLYI